MAGLYIHIPFCRQKCHYCNFYSLASQKYVNQVVEALLQEIRLQKRYLGSEKLNTVYFGGGTPSLIGVGDVNRIIGLVHEVFDVADDAEITLEANPDDINPTYLDELGTTLINRLSIGIQSFDDKDLSYLHRRHNGEKALSAIKQVLAKGFDNLSCDLIYGIPGASDETWTENIKTLVNLKISHISAYSLTVETGTSLDFLIKKGKYSAVDEEKTIAQFSILMDMLEKHGYEHYEISNFSLPGKKSKHNSAYWTGEKYLGIGPSAHSFDGKSRQWNVSNIKTYLDFLQQGSLSFEKEILTKTQKYNEYILTSLRTSRGVDLNRITLDFGKKYHNHFLNESKPFTANGWLIIDEQKATLTRLGKFFADQVASGLFWV